jgi:hypothetical protein
MVKERLREPTPPDACESCLLPLWVGGQIVLLVKNAYNFLR